MIIFEIQNRKEDYAVCYSIMQFIADPANAFNHSGSVTVKLAETEIPNDRGEVSHVLNRAYSLKDSLPSRPISNSDELRIFLKQSRRATTSTYCFFVFDNGDSDETDVVNYHYFEMIRKFNPDKFKCSLGIIPTDCEKKARENSYFRISAFFHAESNSDAVGYVSRYFLDRGADGADAVFKLLAKPNSGSKRFFPLLPTTTDSYRVLAQNTRQLFETEEQRSELFDDKYRKALLDKDRLRSGSHKPYDVYCRSVKLYIAKLFDDLTNGLRERLKTEEYAICFPVERLNSLSVLATAYFLTFVHAIVLPDGTATAIKIIKRILSRDYWEKIEEMIFDAEDFAESTLQLIENAKKHAGAKGFLCFRVFNKSRAEKLSLPQLPDSVGEQYLNVLVSDFNNEFDVPSKFIENLSSYKADKALIAGFKAAKLSLRDFFVPSRKAQKCWDEYFGNTENVALHYGLSVFDQVVGNANGYFMTVSTKSTLASTGDVYQINQAQPEPLALPHIPGTQYNILLPLTAKTSSKPTGLNVTFDYKKFQTERMEFLTLQGDELDGLLVSKDDIYQYDPENKEERISALANFFLKSATENENGALLIYSEKASDPLVCEVFAKSIVYLLSKYTIAGKIKRIAIANASPLLRAVIIRVLGTLYYKRSNSEVIKNVEIYICGEFGRPEIEFVGNSIDASIAATEMLASGRAEYARDVSLLKNVRNKCDNVPAISKTDLFPFDIAVFRQLVTDDLERNIQKHPFGCRLEGIHMRVGSKIHVTDCFYEATLLFGIENYVSRFAYLLAQKINEKIKEHDKIKSFVLVGYETYSEMLVLETKKALSILYDLQCEYIIYDDSAEQKFKDYGRVPPLQISNTNFIVIVPIGSTLTTHDKILAHLGRDKKYPGFTADSNVLANLCVVLIRDKYEFVTIPTECEDDYWISVNESTVTLKDEYIIGNKNTVDYLVSVKGKWELPHKCSKCYPSARIDEEPILKVNKASVVPMVLYGLKEDKFTHLKNTATDVYLDTHIDLLRNTLHYGHYVRGDNHFEYYPRTGVIMTELFKPENLRVFDDWLKDLRDKINDPSRDVRNEYHFVVAPQHHTNARFVMKVREKVFDKSAAIIWLDVKREYRDNIKTKYSYLSQLFINLVSSGTGAEIHFHYVDDTITSGATYERTRDLMQSLFNSHALREQGYKGVRVKLFSSVTVLLNRHSTDSLLRYAPLDRYFGYINLYISSLRNHEDACVLCKKHNDYDMTCKLSATNVLAKEFQVRSNRYKLMPYSEAESVFYSEDEERKRCDKGFCRMLLTHELNLSLNDLGYLANDDTYVYTVILDTFRGVLSRDLCELFPNMSRTRTDAICDLLHVISSPFFSFRKSNLAAAFKFALCLTDYLIFPADRELSPLKDNEMLKSHIDCLESGNHDKDLIHLIKSLFSRLSHLGANYIIREDVVNAYFAYVTDKKLAEKDADIWTNFYITAVKTLAVFNPLEERAYRWGKQFQSLSNNPHYKDILHFALLENNTLVYDALQEVTSSLNFGYEITNDTATDTAISTLFINGEIKNAPDNRKKITGILNSYFCDSYRLFATDKKDFLSCDDKTTKDMLNMAVLNLMLIPDGNLSGESGEHKHFYQTLLKYTAKILDVAKVQLFLERAGKKYFIGSSTENEYKAEAKWRDFLATDTSHIGDTYFYDKPSGGKRVTGIKIENNFNGMESGTQAAWYLVFETAEEAELFPDLLSNARNLLVMRHELLVRLKKDYDNNLFDEFATQNEQISLLADDKTGFHTPFPELDDEFEKTRNAIETAGTLNLEAKLELAVKLKLIADAYISKWHVCRVIDRLPEQIQPNKKRAIHMKTLSELLDIAKLLKTKNGRKIDFRCYGFVDNYTIDIPDKCKPAWISIIISLALNAMRHGSPKESPAEDTVIIKMEKLGDKLKISNAAFEDENETNRGAGITEDTIKWFFYKFGYVGASADYEYDEGVYRYYFIIPLKMPDAISNKKEEQFCEKDFAD